MIQVLLAIAEALFKLDLEGTPGERPVTNASLPKLGVAIEFAPGDLELALVAPVEQLSHPFQGFQPERCAELAFVALEYGDVGEGDRLHGVSHESLGGWPGLSAYV